MDFVDYVEYKFDYFQTKKFRALIVHGGEHLHHGSVHYKCTESNGIKISKL